MIIHYDVRPDASIDDKLRSLIQSIQLALNEIGEPSGSASQGGDVSAILGGLQQLNEEMTSVLQVISALDGRVTDLEDTTEIPTYNSLADKPSIEGVTLTGDKTFPELNLDVIPNTELESILSNLT